jgi:hypothetical protein
MTRNVIEMVHTRPDKDSMPSGLKITTKPVMILHSNTLIGPVESESSKDTTGKKDYYDTVSQAAIAAILHDTKSTQLPLQDEIQ